MDRETAQSRACCGDKWLDTLYKHTEPGSRAPGRFR